MRRLTIALFIMTFGLLSLVDAQEAMMGDQLPQAKLRVTITNTSNAQVFSPPVATTHKGSYVPFQLGEPLLPELEALAEDGDASDFVTLAAVMNDRISDVAVADGPLPPGESVTLELAADPSYPYISVFGMLVTTNDGVFFFGDDWEEDATRGDVMLPGPLYSKGVFVLDAGSEANTESCQNIPGPPCGNPHSRVTDMAEGVVTEHPGILGIGDLDADTLNWSSPAATVVVEMMGAP